MHWRPRLQDGTATVNLSLPQRPWSPISRGIGGRDVAASGIPEAFEIRRERRVRVVLRVTEAEWPAVRALLERAQQGASFTWRFDQDEAGTQHTVYLDEPEMGEEIEPVRDDAFPTVYELALVLRTTAGTAIEPVWLP